MSQFADILLQQRKTKLLSRFGQSLTEAHATPFTVRCDILKDDMRPRQPGTLIVKDEAIDECFARFPDQQEKLATFFLDNGAAPFFLLQEDMQTLHYFHHDQEKAVAITDSQIARVLYTWYAQYTYIQDASTQLVFKHQPEHIVFFDLTFNDEHLWCFLTDTVILVRGTDKMPSHITRFLEETPDLIGYDMCTVCDRYGLIPKGYRHDIGAVHAVMFDQQKALPIQDIIQYYALSMFKAWEQAIVPEKQTQQLRLVGCVLLKAIQAIWKSQVLYFEQQQCSELLTQISRASMNYY